MKRIMLVEDDRNTARAVETRLTSEGYATATAHSLQEAVNVARQEPFDLFLLDVGLPDGDGISLASQLIALPGAQATPIVFLTGNGDLNCRLLASKLGVCAWVDKPYQPDELRQAVAMALGQTESTRSFSPLAPLSQSPAPRKLISVLVIEDDTRLALALKCRLEKTGYEVLTAHTGGEGLKAAVKHRPDLILSDIYMPGGLGFMIFDLLAERGVTNIPVIFLTGSKRPGLKNTALKLGATDFFEKPCDFPEVLRSVRRSLFQNKQL